MPDESKKDIPHDDRRGLAERDSFRVNGQEWKVRGFSNDSVTLEDKRTLHRTRIILGTDNRDFQADRTQDIEIFTIGDVPLTDLTKVDHLREQLKGVVYAKEWWEELSPDEQEDLRIEYWQLQGDPRGVSKIPRVGGPAGPDYFDNQYWKEAFYKAKGAERHAKGLLLATVPRGIHLDILRAK